MRTAKIGPDLRLVLLYQRWLVPSLLSSRSVMERLRETDYYSMPGRDVPCASLVDIRVREERLLFCTHQFQRRQGQLLSFRVSSSVKTFLKNVIIIIIFRIVVIFINVVYIVIIFFRRHHRQNDRDHLHHRQ